MKGKGIKLLSLLLCMVMLAGVLPVAADAMEIFAKTSEKTLTLTVEPTDSILDVREKVSEIAGVAPAAVKLTFDGKTLEDGKFLSDYNIQKESTILVEYIVFTVNFDENGHGTAPGEQTVILGLKVEEPQKPTEEGYLFGGWYKDAECTQAWAFDKDTVTEAVTLYAKWTEHTHEFGEPTYSWSEDYSTCTAEKACTNPECDHKVTETVDSTSEETKQPTCTEKGTTTYTAEFTGEGFATQTRDVENLNPLNHTGGSASCFEKAICERCHEGYGELEPHTYGTSSYTWAEDGSACTAEKTCTVSGCGDKVTENGKITSSVEVKPDCENKGTTKYTATFEGEGFSTQTKELEDIPATHSFETTWSSDAKKHWHAATCEHTTQRSDEAEHTWADGKCSVCQYVCAHTGGEATCTDKAECENCHAPYGEVDKENHTGTPEWKQTAEKHEKIYSCCDAVAVAEEDHSWEDGKCSKCEYVCTHGGSTPSYEWAEDGSVCTGTLTCGTCGETVTEEVTATGTVKTPATCDTDGVTTYTAAFTKAGFTTQTKDLKDIPASHAFEEDWSWDEGSHWHAAACEHKDEKKDEAEHTWEKGKCTVCDYEDEEAPAVTISAQHVDWTELHKVEYGLYTKNTVKVTMTAEDTGSGDVTLYYLLSTKAMTEAELADAKWTAYKSGFSLTDEGRTLVYGKAVDQAGNTTYVNTDWIIIDKTAPVLRNIANGETYYSTTPWSFRVSESYLDKVTLDGTTLTPGSDGTYQVPADGKAHLITAVDIAGNSTSATVTVQSKATVSFEAEGDALEPIEVTYNTAIGDQLPKLPKISGFQPNGYWAMDSVTGKKVTADTVITEDCTLYAVYVKAAAEDVTDIKGKDNYGGAVASNLQLRVPFTEEEKTLMEYGVPMKVWLEVKSDSGNDLINKKLSGYKVGKSLTIRVYKCLEGGEPQLVHELASATTITMQIPDSLLSAPTGYYRYFRVLREHDGEVKTLTASVSRANKTVRFTTDLFSDYAICYKDVKSIIPQTSDDSPITLMAVTMLVSLAGVTAMLVLGKRFFRKKEN